MMSPDDIRIARARLRMTQAELAQRIGVDQSTISRLEREGIPEKGPIWLAIEHVLAELGQLPTNIEAAE